MVSIYSAAASTGTLREVGCFNTTATAVAVFLTRVTDTGTQGAGQTEARHNMKGPPALCTVFTTHTGNVTLGEDLGYRAQLGAAVGSGVIWTFGDSGLVIGAADAVEAVTNGIGLILENGTGQALQAYMVWDE
jgi:hypothetical protein